ncbi:hypothetical protein E2C01_084908 [Portunus trituberculatus]|uniref:Uncharacterized protein n=1 Tax=Portunus trituberculatus TaxID=210409 RepID=A0A5B7JC54_PORTR|nr:hypothetical protein [Portunus trituberculatus]
MEGNASGRTHPDKSYPPMYLAPIPYPACPSLPRAWTVEGPARGAILNYPRGGWTTERVASP